MNELDASGERILGEVTPNENAKVVRRRGDQLLIADGPFSETQEQIVGFDIVEAQTVDRALETAARHPMARGGLIEVRPFMQRGDSASGRVGVACDRFGAAAPDAACLNVVVPADDLEPVMDVVGDDPELIERLRRDLVSADFTVETLDALWGEPAAAALFRGQRVAAARRAAERVEQGVPVAALATAFVLGLPVPAPALARALPALGIDGAVALGLVAATTRAEGAVTTDTVAAASHPFVRPLVDLRPYAFVDALGSGSWWICSDLGELALGRALREDHVLGVGGASNTLSAIMIRDRVGVTLDLGTGCGIQALHAARHSEKVVATDISVRALRFAELNAVLNGVRNIRFVHGSLFDPVAGERFDQIVSNPPFVITPRVAGVPEYEYRDGGLSGDEIVEAVMRGAREHLNPGGVAQFLGNWEYHGDGAAFDRVRTWLGDPRESDALDAWVVERELQDAPQYAETWIRDGGTRPGTAEFERLTTAWLDDFAARGVSHVGFGYVTLRRRSESVGGGARLRRFETVESRARDAGLGAHFSRALRVADWLDATPDDRLRLASLIVASDVTEERHFWPGQDDPMVIAHLQGGGFGRRMPCDTALAGFVGACDGELPVGVIIGALADLLDVDAAELAADLLPRIRERIFVGMLEPADLVD